MHGRHLAGQTRMAALVERTGDRTRTIWRRWAALPEGASAAAMADQFAEAGTDARKPLIDPSQHLTGPSTSHRLRRNPRTFVHVAHRFGTMAPVNWGCRPFNLGPRLRSPCGCCDLLVPAQQPAERRTTETRCGPCPGFETRPRSARPDRFTSSKRAGAAIEFLDLRSELPGPMPNAVEATPDLEFAIVSTLFLRFAIQHPGGRPFSPLAGTRPALTTRLVRGIFH